MFKKDCISKKIDWNFLNVICPECIFQAWKEPDKNPTNEILKTKITEPFEHFIKNDRDPKLNPNHSKILGSLSKIKLESPHPDQASNFEPGSFQT